MNKKQFSILLISIVLAAFLGAFAASVFVFGNRQPAPPAGFGPAYIGDKPMMPDEILEHQKKLFDNFEKINDDIENVVEHSPAGAGFVFVNNKGLKTEETKDAYKIIVDLKPFNKDEKNVDVKTLGNSIIISANYKSKDKNEFSSSQFYQSLSLPIKIDEKTVKKVKQGDSLVIIIPKK